MVQRFTLLVVVTLTQFAAGQTLSCGDCDSSGALPATVLDALRGAQMAAGLVPATPLDVCLCDVDGSGVVSVLDALQMAQAAAGLPVSFGCAAPLCGAPQVQQLDCAMPVNGTVPFDDPGLDLGQVSYNAHFEIAALPMGTTAVTISITAGTGDLDLYVGDVGTAAADPLPAAYAFSSVSPGTSLESVLIDGGTVPTLAAYAGGPIAVTVHGVVAGNFTLELSCSSVTALPPTFNPLPTGPPARVFASGVLDTVRERVIVFGGYDGARLNDTWAFDLITDTWSQLLPTGSLPNGSDGVLAAFDPAGNRMLFYGGSGTGTETWELDFSGGAHGVWTRLTPAGTNPPNRIYGAAIHDPVAGRILIYGGGGAGVADLWELSLTPGAETWTELFPAGGPMEPMRDQTGVYDSARHRIVLYAGMQSSGVSGRAFEIDLTTGPAGTWSELLPTAPGLGRWHHSAVYDPIGDRMLAYAGIEPSFSPPHYDDVAALTSGPGSTWTDVSPPTRPTGRYGAVLVADLTRRRAILFSGTSGSYGPGVLGDTWSMDF